MRPPASSRGCRQNNPRGGTGRRCATRFCDAGPLCHALIESPMFQPLPLFIGLRYVRSRQHKFFISLISWVSLLGLALGVAALIVVLSVMNGFAGELRERLLTFNADARVVDPGTAPVDADRALAARLQRLPGVVGVAPYIELTALAVHLPDMVPVLLRGIDPALERHIADVRPLLVQGSLDALVPGSNALII